MFGCPVVNERNISKSENLEIFCSQNFDCCSGKSFGENSQSVDQWLLSCSLMECAIGVFGNVPILGAEVTLFGGDRLLWILMIFH